MPFRTDKKNRLKIFSQKIKGILFNKKTKLSPPPKLYLNNLDINFTDTIKILGLIFDKKLSRAPYLETIKKSCIERLNTIKTFFSNNWGADKDTLLETYRALIRSRLDNGSTVYNSAKSYTKKIILPISHTALRLAKGAYRTCSTNSLLFEVKEMAVESRSKFLILKYALKVSSTPNNPSYNNIFSNKYKAFNINKPKISFRCHIRLIKVLQSTTFKIHLVIERKLSQIPPWTLGTKPTNTSLVELSKRILSSIPRTK